MGETRSCKTTGASVKRASAESDAFHFVVALARMRFLFRARAGLPHVDARRAPSSMQGAAFFAVRAEGPCSGWEGLAAERETERANLLVILTECGRAQRWPSRRRTARKRGGWGALCFACADEEGSHTKKGEDSTSGREGNRVATTLALQSDGSCPHASSSVEEKRGEEVKPTLTAPNCMCHCSAALR